ncbi:radical SAM protein [Candidatus Woesearchaeota archaeon]|nr:radical SAM protein [Candidatus Woesearchaeota archaeon]
MKQEKNQSHERLDAVPIVFEEEFPSGYKNNVAHWGNFAKEELHQKTAEGLEKLLHLDIDFGNSCSLRCPHCFRRDDRFDSAKDQGFLNEDEIKDYLLEAKSLGLQSVKFLGRGEPFENPKFLGFLEWLTNNEIHAAIFTKGHVIGSDELAKKYNSQYEVNSGQELADRLKELDISVLLGFNSFDREMQESFVGIDKSPIKDYVELRDNALTRLVKAGLNEYSAGEPTRLAMISAPIKPENIDEIFEIYKWARKRNIYALSCPSTNSGKGIDETERVRQHEEFMDNLRDLYTNIYIWNIENNLMTLEQFKEEGVSLYPGCHPCNQTAAGMYLTLSGKVVRCPGRADNKSTFSDDIRKQGLKNVWINSENYRRAQGKIKSPEGNDFNYHCPARDWTDDDGHKSIPADFYQEIKNRVIDYFKK